MSQNQLLTSLVTKAVTCMLAACLVTPELQPHQSGNWHWRQWQFLKNIKTSRITQPTTSFSLLPWYTCPLFQRQMHKILAFSWPGFPKTSQRLPKLSDGFPKTSEHCQKCPKMSWQRQRFSLFIMRLRTICVDLWVRCEKLSLMLEINAFSPQAWDSHIMRECEQVQHGLRSQILTLRHKTNTVSLNLAFPKIIEETETLMFEKVCIQKQHTFKAFLYGHLFIIIM